MPARTWRRQGVDAIERSYADGRFIFNTLAAFREPWNVHLRTHYVVNGHVVGHAATAVLFSISEPQPMTVAGESEKFLAPPHNTSPLTTTMKATRPHPHVNNSLDNS